MDNVFIFLDAQWSKVPNNGCLLLPRPAVIHCTLILLPTSYHGTRIFWCPIHIELLTSTQKHVTKLLPSSHPNNTLLPLIGSQCSAGSIFASGTSPCQYHPGILESMKLWCWSQFFSNNASELDLDVFESILLKDDCCSLSFKNSNSSDFTHAMLPALKVQ